MKQISVALLAICMSVSVIAQQRSATQVSAYATPQPLDPEKVTRCSTMEVDARLRQEHPEMGTHEEFEQWIAQKIAELPQNPMHRGAAVRTIPTIVHIIHNGSAVGSGQNISQAQVNSQITALNNDYRRTNSDAANTPSAFQGVAADCEIEFCLAKVDPQGNVLPEPGIDRINRNTKGWTAPPYTSNYIDGTIKPNSVWDPTKYFNIWVMDLGNDLLGYAQFPSNSGLGGLGANGGSANTDGVVILYTAFGTTGNVAFPYNKGRTATHEVGHWLGLRHIWGDSNCGNDFCGDTPTQQQENYNCPTFPQVSCSNGPNGNMFMNYMDYPPDACMNLFTLNQKQRMDAVLANSPRRVSLLSSTVCNLSNDLVANFTSSPSTACAGNPVQFNFTGTAPSGSTPTFAWTFTGGTPGSSTAQNPSVTFVNPGTYNVSLTVSANGQSDTKNSTITVITCGAGCDTLGNINAADQLALYRTGTGSWGFVSGHNGYGDIAKADVFSYTGPLPATVSQVFLGFGKAYQSAANHTFEVKLWADNSGTPGAVLGTTTVQVQNAIDAVTNQQALAVSFPSAINLTSNKFYAGIQFTYNGDSLALLTNQDGNTSPGTAWEMWSDNSWHPYSATDSWQIDVAHFIYPEVCRPAISIDEPLDASLRFYPNPSDGHFTLEMGNLQADKLSMQVTDVQGRTVHSETLSAQWGELQKGFNFSHFTPGTYFVRLLTEEGKYANFKFVIQQ